MLIREISSSIIEKCEGFNVSDDFLLTESYVWYLMDIYRAVLLRERVLTGIDSFYQMNCCIEVDCDRITCDGFDSGESIFFARVPELIDVRGNIKYFGSADFSRRKGMDSKIDIISFEEWLSIDFAEWTHMIKVGTYIHGYKDGDSKEQHIILLKNLPTDGVKKLCLFAIYARPIENLCNQEIDDFNYPIPADLIAKLELLVVTDIIEQKRTEMGDPINDTAALKSASMIQGGVNNEQK
jgi:hypothetical protein